MMTGRLSSVQREELELLMERRAPDGALQASISGLHGFLVNILSGPMLMPSQWIHDVFDGPDDLAWDDIDQARRAMTLLMQFYNEVNDELRSGQRGFSILINRLGDEPATVDLANDWARGYVYGIALRRPLWEPALNDPQLTTCFDPIYTMASSDSPDPFEDAERYTELMDALPRCALEIYEWWRLRLVGAMRGAQTFRRAQAKISPNAPCACGSGKKYKRCCSPLRSTSP